VGPKLMMWETDKPPARGGPGRYHNEKSVWGETQEFLWPKRWAPDDGWGGLGGWSPIKANAVKERRAIHWSRGIFDGEEKKNLWCSSGNCAGLSGPKKATERRAAGSIILSEKKTKVSLWWGEKCA